MRCMKRTLALLGLMGLLASLLLCADVTGKWKGSFDAGGATREITFDLKASGDAVTGTIGGMPEQTSEIKDGKVQGDSVSFWFMTEYQGNPIKLVCKGQLAGDEIRFTMGLEDGQWSTDFVAKKSS
ncbi:conserved exported hypothetical protein [Candidatus Sulfopaludibacter sp. SbA6]|nr:conserved exported hypothetical protein [Candidatus Sulfopaludibacter sp. SbA6]